MLDASVEYCTKYVYTLILIVAYFPSFVVPAMLYYEQK